MRRFLPAAALGLLPFSAFAVENNPAANAVARVSQTAESNGDQEGRALMEENCLVCHEDSYIRSAHLTRDQWGEVLDLMIGMGMPPLEPEIQTTVLDYLEENHGPRGESGTAASNPAAGASANSGMEELPWAYPRYRPNPLIWKER